MRRAVHLVAAASALLAVLAVPAHAGKPTPLEQIQWIAQTSMEEAWFAFVQEGGSGLDPTLLFAETGSWSQKKAGFGMGSDVDATCRGCTPKQAKRIQDLYDANVEEWMRQWSIPRDGEVARYFSRHDRNVYDGTVDRLKRYQQPDSGRTLDQVRRDAGDAYGSAYRMGADCTQVSGADSERWINGYTGEKGRVYTTDLDADFLTGQAARDKLDARGGRFDSGSQGTAAASFTEQINERFHDPPTRTGPGYGTHPREARVQSAAKATSRINGLDPATKPTPSGAVMANLANRSLDKTPSQELRGQRHQITRQESINTAQRLQRTHNLSPTEANLVSRGLQDQLIHGENPVSRAAAEVLEAKGLDLNHVADDVRATAQDRAFVQLEAQTTAEARRIAVDEARGTMQQAEIRQEKMRLGGNKVELANDIAQTEAKMSIIMDQMDDQGRQQISDAAPEGQRATLDRADAVSRGTMGQARRDVRKTHREIEAVQGELAYAADPARRQELQRKLDELRTTHGSQTVQLEDQIQQHSTRAGDGAIADAEEQIKKAAGGASGSEPTRAQVQQAVDTCAADKACRKGLAARATPVDKPPLSSRVGTIAGHTLMAVDLGANAYSMVQSCVNGSMLECTEASTTMALEYLVPPAALVNLSKDVVMAASSATASHLEDQVIKGMYRGGRNGLGILNEMGGGGGGTLEEDRAWLYEHVSAHVRSQCGADCPPGSEAFRVVAGQYLAAQAENYVFDSETDVGNAFTRIKAEGGERHHWKSTSVQKLTATLMAEMDVATVGRLEGPLQDRVAALEAEMDQGVVLNRDRVEELYRLQGTLWDITERQKAKECGWWGLSCPKPWEVEEARDQALRDYATKIRPKNAHNRVERKRLLGLDVRSNGGAALSSALGKAGPNGANAFRIDPDVVLDEEKLKALATPEDRLLALVETGDYRSAMYCYVAAGRGKPKEAIEWVMQKAQLMELSQQRADEAGVDLTHHVNTLGENLARAYDESRVAATARTRGFGEFVEDKDEASLDRVQRFGGSQPSSSERRDGPGVQALIETDAARLRDDAGKPPPPGVRETPQERIEHTVEDDGGGGDPLPEDTGGSSRPRHTYTCYVTNTERLAQCMDPPRQKVYEANTAGEAYQMYLRDLPPYDDECQDHLRYECCEHGNVHDAAKSWCQEWGL